MKNEENSKQLKTALTEHKTLKIDLNDNQELILYWDKEISNYRGCSKKLKTEVGIWDFNFLFSIANGKTPYKLYIY